MSGDENLLECLEDLYDDLRYSEDARANAWANEDDLDEEMLAGHISRLREEIARIESQLVSI